MKLQQLEGKTAVVQVGFGMTLWVHDDPQVMLSFAERKVKDTHVMLDSFIRYTTEVPIENCDIYLGRYVLSREQALSLIGKHDLVVQQFRPLDNGQECSGEIANIFTIESTKNQLSGSPITDLGGGMYSTSPFTVDRLKVKQIK